MKRLIILLIPVAVIACSKDKASNNPHNLLQKHSWAYDSTIYHLPTGDIKDYASITGNQTLVFTEDMFTNTNAQGTAYFSYTFDIPNMIRYRNQVSSSSSESLYTIESVNNKNLVLSEVEITGTGNLVVTNYYHAK